MQNLPDPDRDIDGYVHSRGNTVLPACLQGEDWDGVVLPPLLTGDGWGGVARNRSISAICVTIRITMEPVM